MSRALSQFRCNVLNSTLMRTAYSPAESVAFFHSSIVRRAAYEAEHAENASKNPALSAFGARLGLGSLSPTTLQQAVTHMSKNDLKNNAKLVHLGKRAAGLFVCEYFYSKYPVMHADAIQSAAHAYLRTASLARMAQEAGIQDVMLFEREYCNQRRALSECFFALIGAVYQEKGPEAAKEFIHGHILSRPCDLTRVFKVDNPKHRLSTLLRNLKKEPATSRLLSETGRLSASPVFVVGVFSGQEKLGEGFGSSLKMAEHRACQDALKNYYGKEEKDFTLPSDAERVENYKPPALYYAEGNL